MQSAPPFGRLLHEFDQLISAAAERARGLAQAAGGGGGNPLIPPGALAELDEAIEELHVSHEEMRQIHDALIAAEGRAAAERARYLDLFGAAPVAYITTDANGVIEEANGAAGALLRRNALLLRGKPLAVFVAHDDRSAFRRFVAGATAARADAHRLTARCRSTRGATFPAAWTMTPVRNPARQVVGLRWILRALDEESPFTSELLLLRGVVTAIAHLSEQAIIVLDREDRVTLWNGAAEKLLGWPEDDMVGRRAPAELLEAAALTLSSVPGALGQTPTVPCRLATRTGGTVSVMALIGRLAADGVSHGTTILLTPRRSEAPG